jgi:hypothetical protein
VAVNAREIADLYDKLSKLTGDNESFSLASMPKQLEDTVINKKLFDETTVTSFIKSKKELRYEIHLTDSDLIKNIKALINLLVSFSEIKGEYIQSLIEYLDKQGFKSIFSALKLGVTMTKERKALGTVHADFMAFMYYLEQIRKLLPDISTINTETNAKLQRIADVFANTELNKLVRSIQQANETRAAVNIEGKVPDIQHEDLKKYLNSDELTLDIEAIIQITSKLKKYDIEAYDQFADRYNISATAENIVQTKKNIKVAYNAARDLEHAIKEALLTLAKIEINPLYRSKSTLWKELSEEARTDYIKLYDDIQKTNSNLTILEQLRDTHPAINKIIKRNHEKFQLQKDWLANWQISKPALAIERMASALNMEDGLNGVIESAAQNLTEEERVSNLNQQTHLFDIPQDIAANKKNMMLIYNMTAYAQQALQKLRDAQGKTWTVTKIPDVLSILRNVVKMAGEYQALNQSTLSDAAKEILQNDINNVLAEFIPIYNTTIELVIETEIRLGLREGAIMEKIGDAITAIEKNMDMLAKHSPLPIANKLTIAKQPFTHEKHKIINRIKSETVERLKMHLSVLNYFKSKPRATETPVNLLKTLSQLRKVDSLKSRELANQVLDKINRLTGMDNLIYEASVLEFQLLAAINKASILFITAADLEKAANDANLKSMIAKLKELYEYKNTLNEILAAADACKHNPPELDKIKFKMFLIKSKGKYSLELIHSDATGFLGKSLSDYHLLAQAQNETPNEINGILERDKNLVLKLDAMLSKIGFPSEQPAIPQDIAPKLDDAAIEAIIPAVIPAENSVFLKQVLNTAKGSIVLQSESSRIELIAKTCLVLSAEQAASLSDDKIKNGFYEPHPNDRILVINVKRIYNAMFSFEVLMEKINILITVLSGGITHAISINEKIKQLKDNIKSLFAHIKHINDGLFVLRQYIEYGVYDAVKNNMSHMLQKLTELAGSARLAGTDLQAKLINLVMPDENDHSNKGKAEASDIIDIDSLNEQITHLQESVNALSSEHSQQPEHAGSISWLQTCNSIISDLRSRLRDIPTKPDGSYDIEKLQPGSLEKNYAALINAAYKVNDASNALVKMSEGHNISGFFSLISSLLSANTLIAETNLGKWQDQVKDTYTNARDKIILILKEMIKSALPQIRQVVARTALTEHLLGVNADNISKQLFDTVGQFDDLAKHFGFKEWLQLKNDFPFNKEQAEMVAAEIQNLTRLSLEEKDKEKQQLISQQLQLLTMLQSTLGLPQPIDSPANSPSPQTQTLVPVEPDERQTLLPVSANLGDHDEQSRKIDALNQACIDYKHHLAVSMRNRISKKYPGIKLGINLATNIRLPAELKRDHFLFLGAKKYNAAHSMQQKLSTHGINNAERLQNFNNEFKMNRALLKRCRTPAGIIFLKVLATILSLGIAAAFGMWGGSPGRRTVKDMEEIQPPVKRG